MRSADTKSHYDINIVVVSNYIYQFSLTIPGISQVADKIWLGVIYLCEKQYCKFQHIIMIYVITCAMHSVNKIFTNHRW